MARQYQPKKFFRNAPNYLLEEYFKKKGVFSEIDFKEMKQTKIEPVYEAWLNLDEKKRVGMERDFREIFHLASEGGVKAILDKAEHHGEELGPNFCKMKGHYDRAFWTFLYRPAYWKGALLFYRADRAPRSYWRRRSNMPKVEVNIGSRDMFYLEKMISTYFHKNEGRGKNCRVEYFKRHNLDYFFAYPEDYTQSSIEWIENTFERRPHSPAFEIIFVYSQIDGTLDIFLRGSKKPLPELQDFFRHAILRSHFLPEKEGKKVYDLNLLKNRNFQFVYEPESGIEDVRVRMLRLTSKTARREKIILEADPTREPGAVYDLLRKIENQSMHRDDFHVTQVGLRAYFTPEGDSNRSKTRSFNISHPNSCNLKMDDRDLVLRKMLADSGLEPREKPKPKPKPILPLVSKKMDGRPIPPRVRNL